MFKQKIPLVISLAMLCLVCNAQSVYAAVKISPEGSWKVAGTTASGSVGSIVPLDFSLTSVSDRCITAEFILQTTGEAREKLSFVGTTLPASSSVSSESINWSKAEFEDGVSKRYRVNLRIDRGSIGDEIEGFQLYIYCSHGQSSVFGVIADAAIKVTAKAAPAVSKTKVLAKVSSTDLINIFKSVYGRNPTASEKKYWTTRLLDKPDRTALKGAIMHHKKNKVRH